MAQIVKRNDLGSSIGRALGSGVGAGLDYIINKKLGEVAQRQRTKDFELLGFDQQKASALSRLDPQIAQQYVKNHLESPQRDRFQRALGGEDIQQPESAQQFVAQQHVPPQVMSPHTQISPQAMMALQALQGQQIPNMFPDNPALNQLMTSLPQNAWENGLAQYGIENMQPELEQQLAPEQQKPPVYQQPTLKKSERMRKALEEGGFSFQQAKYLHDAIAKQEELEQKASIHTQKEARADRTEFLKETAKQREKIRDAADVADKHNIQDRKLIDLLKTGKPITGATYKLLEQSGLLPVFTNPETDEAQSILDGLATGAGSAFGTSRVNQQEVELYRRYLGTLARTPQGLIQIARMRMLERQADKLKGEALSDVMKGLKKEVPGDLTDAIKGKVGKKLEHIHQLMMNEFAIGQSDEMKKYQKEGERFEVGGIPYVYRKGEWKPEEGDYFL